MSISMCNFLSIDKWSLESKSFHISSSIRHTEKQIIPACSGRNSDLNYIDLTQPC